MVRERTHVIAAHYGIVVVYLRTLEVNRSCGQLAALEYEYGGNLQYGLLVEILLGERDVDVCGDYAVVQFEHFGRAGEFYVILVLGHLLEAVAARECQGGSREYKAQFHHLFHDRLRIKSVY